MWWTCSKAKAFWSMVNNFIFQVGINLEFKPYTYLLTILSSDILSSLRCTLLHIIVTARILYPQCWKSSQVPTDELLKQKLRTCIEMDRLTSILNSESNDFKAK